MKSAVRSAPSPAGSRGELVALPRRSRPLFQDSLLACGRPPGTRRPWTVLFSLLLQGLLLAGLIGLPLLVVPKLPARESVSYLVAPPPPPPPAPAALRAIISRQESIEDLQVVSGHPMLVEAALAAVKQWRYRPYLLNGKPVEVVTIITVTFRLQ